MNSRGYILIGIGAALAVAVAMLVIAPPASATNDPPGTGGTVTGDWTVTDARSYSSCTITVQDGNLYIASGGTLTLTTVRLVFEQTLYPGYNYTLEVQAGGTLNADRKCTITSQTTSTHYIFAIKANGVATINGSTISEMWGDSSSWKGGIQIYSDGVTITNCTITNGMTGGLSIFDCSPTIYQNSITANGQDGKCATYCYGLYASNTKSNISSNRIDSNKYYQSISSTIAQDYTSPTGPNYYTCTYNGKYYSGYPYSYCYRYYYFTAYYVGNYFGTGAIIEGGSKATFYNNTVTNNGANASRTYNYYSYSYSPWYVYVYFNAPYYSYYNVYYCIDVQQINIYDSVTCKGMGLIISNSNVAVAGNTFDSNGFISKCDFYPYDNSVAYFTGEDISMTNSDGDITDNTINNAAILVNLTNSRTNLTGNKMMGDYIGGAGSYSANLIPSKNAYGIKTNNSVVSAILNNTLTIQYRDYPYFYLSGSYRSFANVVTAIDLGPVAYPIRIEGNKITIDNQYYGWVGVYGIKMDLRTDLKFFNNQLEYKRSNLYGGPTTAQPAYLLYAGNRNNVLIENCTIKGPLTAVTGAPPSPAPTKNGQGIVYGVLTSYGTTLTVVNSTFTGCDLMVQGLYAVEMTIHDSTFSGNGIAVQGLYAAKVKAYNMTISGAYVGLQAAYASSADIFNVSFKNCENAVQVTDFSKLKLDASFITASKYLSLDVEGNTKATVTNCQMSGSGRGVMSVGSPVFIQDCTMAHSIEFILDKGANVDVFSTPHTKGAATMVDLASYLNVSWQVRFTVSWQNDVPVKDASVLFATLTGAKVFSGTTDETGSPADTLWVKEYMGHNGVVFKYNPHRITCAKGRASSTDFFMIDQKLNLTFRLVDSVPPELTVTYPFDLQMLNTSMVSFRGKASDPEAGLLDGVVHINIDNTGWTGIEVNPLDGTWNLTRPLGDGNHIIQVKALDLVGNINRASLTVLVDTVGPVLQVFSPLEGSSTNQRTLMVTGITEVGALVTVNGLPAQLDKRFFSKALSLEDGPNVLSVSASDGSGNTRTVLVHVVLDTQPPLLDIREPKPGAHVNQNPISISGITEPLAAVTVNGVRAQLVNNSFEALAGMSEGINTIMIKATDAAGNTNSRTLTVFLDTSAPDLSIFTPHDELWTNQSIVLVTGATEEGAQVTINGQNTNVASTVISGYVGLLEGPNHIEIVAKDLAGNIRRIERTVFLDTRLPDLVVTSPAEHLIMSTRIVPVVGSVDYGAEVRVNGETVQVVDFVFSTTVAYAKDGNQVVEISARDQAGNTAIVTRTVVIDTTTPVITLTYPVDGIKVKQRLLIVSGQTEPYATVIVNTATMLVVGRDGLFQVPVVLEDGENRITVKATDSAGNSATEAASVTKPVTKAAPKEDLSWVLNLTGLLLGIGLALPVMTYALSRSWSRRREGVLAELEAADSARKAEEAKAARRAALPTVEKMGKKKVKAPEPPMEEPAPSAPAVLPEAPKAESAAPDVAKTGLKDKSGATEASPDEIDQETRMKAKTEAPAEENRPQKAETSEGSLKDKGGESEGEAGETEVAEGSGKKK